VRIAAPTALPCPPGLLWLKGAGPAPEGDKTPEATPQDADTKRAPRQLVCARCAHRITSDAHRTTAAGAHTHDKVNPFGLTFRFGCFSRAEGCAVEGTPTLENSWFAGYTWQYALCAACAAHLGWFFAGEGSFFGLILDRLIEPS